MMGVVQRYFNRPKDHDAKHQIQQPPQSLKPKRLTHEIFSMFYKGLPPSWGK